eukprot:3531541-Prymnesium_polylepis.1
MASRGATDAAVKLNQAISASTSVGDLLALTRRERATLNLVNCVTALQRLAKLAAEDAVPAASIEHITTRATACFGPGAAGLQTRHISGALWACAKLKVAPHDMVRAVLSSADAMQPSWFKPVEVSMAVWAVGKLGLAPATAGAAQFVAKLLPFALARSHAFDSQGLSNL